MPTYLYLCPSGNSLEIVEIKVYGRVELSHLLEYVLREKEREKERERVGERERESYTCTCAPVVTAWKSLR